VANKSVYCPYPESAEGVKKLYRCSDDIDWFGVVNAVRVQVQFKQRVLKKLSEEERHAGMSMVVGVRTDHVRVGSLRGEEELL
jgi:hypothetical protein